jgi:ligand-binding sensor domain-containing protein
LKNRLFRIFLLFLLPLSVKAQELIPIHQWRVHLSYNQVIDLERVSTRIIAAAREGIFFYDTSDGSITTLTSLDGIHSSEITSIGYDKDNKLLFIGHSSGVIDIVSEKEVAQLTDLQEDYRNAKRVNEFYFRDSKAYIATEIGLLIYDINKNVFIATYDGLGSTGDDIPVNDVVVFNNKIFAATDEGIIAGPLTGANLNDFRQWEHFEELPPAKGVALAVSGDKLFAALNNEDVYELAGGQWRATNYLSGRTFKALSAGGDELLVTTENNVFSLIADELTPLQINAVQSPEFAFRGPGSTLWIADSDRGLINADKGEVIKASGPDNTISRLEVVNNILYGLPGRSGAQVDGFAAFEKGVWRNYGAQEVDDRFKIPLLKNAYDVASFQGKLFISSFGGGLLVMEGENKVLWDARNSSTPFQAVDGKTYITGLAVTDQGLWIANYGALNPLHLYNGQNFQSFNLSHSLILDIMVAPNGYLVMILDSNGLLVYDPATGNQRHLTSVATNGNLPANNVNDVVFDHDGRMWLATTSGVAYFSSPSILFDPGAEALVPVYNFRSLLRNRNVTSITIDGGGRKWFGTSEGAWLFNGEISEQIHYFNEENSPLLDNMVEDMILIQATGEIFFATPEGLISFRTNASTPARPLNDVRVFPNPVTPDFRGTVGITGIAADANVKITDVAGNLIFQTNANGSTASWNLLDNRGERVTSGVYLVFTAKEDGTEALVGKIAIVR